MAHQAGCNWTPDTAEPAADCDRSTTKNQRAPTGQLVLRALRYWTLGSRMAETVAENSGQWSIEGQKSKNGCSAGQYGNLEAEHGAHAGRALTGPYPEADPKVDKARGRESGESTRSSRQQGCRAGLGRHQLGVWGFRRVWSGRSRA